jgi:hypothetical protein
LAQKWPFHKGFSMILGGDDLNSVSPASAAFRRDRPIPTDKPVHAAASAYTLQGTLSGQVFQKIVTGSWV